MPTDTTLLSRLKSLVLDGAYPEALKVLQSNGICTPKALQSLSDQQDLSLIIAEIYAGDQQFLQLEECLSLLETRSPEISDNIRFIILTALLLLVNGKAHEAQKMLEQALDRNVEQDYFHRIAYHLGQTHLALGDYAKANQLFLICYRFYGLQSNHFRTGLALSALGYAAFQKCFFDVAESYYRKALERYEVIGHSFQLGLVHHMLGIIAYRKGKYGEAIAELTESRKCFRKCSYQVGIVNSRIALARVAMFQGRYDAVERMLKGAYSSARLIKFKRGMALSAEFLGEIYYLRGDYERALQSLKEAEGIALELAPEGDIAVEVYRRIGDVLFAMGKIDDAEEMLSKALALAHRLSDRYELGTILRAFARIAAQRGDMDLARAHFNEAISTLRLIKESFELAKTYVTAAEADMRFMEADLDQAVADELRGEAEYHAVEAMHLYTALGLAGRARDCSELLSRLTAKGDGEDPPARVMSVAFDRKYLVGGALVARSKQMQDVVSKVRQYAPSMLSILVFGETGTGKELVARLIHSLSDRSQGPFVPVNCATLPEPVFESEVFGHKKGAFTGADADKPGLMEQASGGSLFLDEISELSGSTQAKLLRALQEKTIRWVGDARERAVDVRIICASNANPAELLKSGKFREDFFYRIAGHVIALEPLRCRRDDIPAMFAYYAGEDGKPVSVEEGLLELLCDYPWPGNGRELVNITTGLMLAAEMRGGVVCIRDLPMEIKDYVQSERRLAPMRGRKLGVPPSDRDRFLKELIEKSLKRHGGNRSEVARELRIGRSTLYRRMRELGLIEQ